MRKLLLLFLITSAAFAQTAPARGSKTHVLLLDVSGSMRDRYVNHLKDWLVEPILRSSAFSPNDRVIVRSFDIRGNAQFNPNDPQRLYDGKRDVSAILDKVPAQVTPHDTDLVEAMQLALADLNGLHITGDVLIWLITDNEQDIHGVSNIDPLYQRINANKNFRAASLFPLTTENGVKVTPKNSAMVLYLLYYAEKNPALKLDRLADEMGRKLQNDPVTWFPVERAIELDEGRIEANSEPAQLVDGELQLPSVAEGETPRFEIKFRFRSQLRGREIKQGKLSSPKVVLAPPASVEADGAIDNWQPSSISPAALQLKPNQPSSGSYLARVEAGNLTFHPSGFWLAVWSSESEPIDGELLLPLEGVDTGIDSTTLTAVKNLEEIKNIVRQGASAKSTIPLAITFRVTFNSLWRRLAAAILALAALGGLAGVSSLFLIKRRYQLLTPQGERLLTLPLFGRSYLSIGNETAAIITRRFGGLAVAPAGLYAFEGGSTRPRVLKSMNDQFVLESREANRRYEYSVRQASPARAAAAPPDNFSIE